MYQYINLPAMRNLVKASPKQCAAICTDKPKKFTRIVPMHYALKKQAKLISIS
jgi:hypothetical protein